MPDHRDYVLGTDEAEAQRLGVQHRLWSSSAFAIWERAGIRVGSRVLDLGAGPGFTSFDLAQLVGPTGSIVGIEGSPAYVSHFRRRAEALGIGWAEAIEGDLHDLSELLAGRDSFDAAYTRWVPCFLRDPASVFRQAADALKPGGVLVIQDYFSYDTMRLAPRSDVFERVIAAIARHWNTTGNTDVMGHVPGMVREAGLELTDFRILHRAARSGEPLWDWPTIFWPNFLPRMIEAGVISEQDAEQFEQTWTAASENPDAFMMMPPLFEAIATKPHTP